MATSLAERRPRDVSPLGLTTEHPRADGSDLVAPSLGGALDSADARAGSDQIQPCSRAIALASWRFRAPSFVTAADK